MYVVDGTKVRKLRDKKTLTQMELAMKSETTPAYISSVETAQSGKDCSVDFAKRLADGLGVKIEDILTKI